MKLDRSDHCQCARPKQAGVSFGHGTTNAFDGAARLVLAALGLHALDTLEERAHAPEQPPKTKLGIALVDERIAGCAKPAAYLTKEAWLQNVPFTSTSASSCRAPSSPNCWPTARAKARWMPGCRIARMRVLTLAAPATAAWR